MANEVGDLLYDVDTIDVLNRMQSSLHNQPFLQRDKQLKVLKGDVNEFSTVPPQEDGRANSSGLRKDGTMVILDNTKGQLGAEEEKTGGAARTEATVQAESDDESILKQTERIVSDKALSPGLFGELDKKGYTHLQKSVILGNSQAEAKHGPENKFDQLSFDTNQKRGNGNGLWKRVKRRSRRRRKHHRLGKRDVSEIKTLNSTKSIGYKTVGNAEIGKTGNVFRDVPKEGSRSTRRRSRRRRKHHRLGKRDTSERILRFYTNEIGLNGPISKGNRLFRVARESLKEVGDSINTPGESFVQSNGDGAVVDEHDDDIDDIPKRVMSGQEVDSDSDIGNVNDRLIGEMEDDDTADEKAKLPEVESEDEMEGGDDDLGGPLREQYDIDGHSINPPSVSKALKWKGQPGGRRGGRVTGYRKPLKTLSYEERKESKDELLEDQVEKVRKQKELLQRHKAEIRRKNEGSTDEAPHLKPLTDTVGNDRRSAILRATYKTAIKNNKIKMEKTHGDDEEEEDDDKGDEEDGGGDKDDGKDEDHDDGDDDDDDDSGDEVKDEEDVNNDKDNDLTSTLGRLERKVDDLKLLIRLRLRRKHPRLRLRGLQHHQRHRRSLSSNLDLEASNSALDAKITQPRITQATVASADERIKKRKKSPEEKVVDVRVPVSGHKKELQNGENIFFRDLVPQLDGMMHDQKSKKESNLTISQSSIDNNRHIDSASIKTDQNSTTDEVPEEKSSSVRSDVKVPQKEMLRAILSNLQADLLRRKFSQNKGDRFVARQQPDIPLKNKWQKWGETDLFGILSDINEIEEAQKLVTENLKNIDKLQRWKEAELFQDMGIHKIEDRVARHTIRHLKCILRDLNARDVRGGGPGYTGDMMSRLNQVIEKSQMNGPFKMSGLFVPGGRKTILPRPVGRRSGFREMRNRLIRAGHGHDIRARMSVERIPSFPSTYYGAEPNYPRHAKLLRRLHSLIAWNMFERSRLRNRKDAFERDVMPNGVESPVVYGVLGVDSPPSSTLNRIAKTLAELTKKAEMIERNIRMDISNNPLTYSTKNFNDPGLSKEDHYQILRDYQLRPLFSGYYSMPRVIPNHTGDLNLEKENAKVILWKMIIKDLIHALCRRRRLRSRKLRDVAWSHWMDEKEKQKYKESHGMKTVKEPMSDEEYELENKLHDLLTRFPMSEAEYALSNDLKREDSKIAAASDVLKAVIQRTEDKTDEEPFVDSSSAVELLSHGARKRRQTTTGVDKKERDKISTLLKNHQHGKVHQPPKPKKHSGTSRGKKRDKAKKLKKFKEWIGNTQEEKSKNQVSKVPVSKKELKDLFDLDPTVVPTTKTTTPKPSETNSVNTLKQADSTEKAENLKKRGLPLSYGRGLNLGSDVDYFDGDFNEMEDYGDISEEELMRKRLMERPPFPPKPHWPHLLYRYHPSIIVKREAGQQQTHQQPSIVVKKEAGEQQLERYDDIEMDDSNVDEEDYEDGEDLEDYDLQGQEPDDDYDDDDSYDEEEEKEEENGDESAIATGIKVDDGGEDVEPVDEVAYIVEKTETRDESKCVFPSFR